MTDRLTDAEHWTDGKITLISPTLNKRGGHVASSVKSDLKRDNVTNRLTDAGRGAEWKTNVALAHPYHEAK